MHLQSLRKKPRNCDRRAKSNATHGIDTGHGVICHPGVCDGSHGVRPLCCIHPAGTEMFSADVIAL